MNDWPIIVRSATGELGGPLKGELEVGDQVELLEPGGSVVHVLLSELPDAAGRYRGRVLRVGRVDPDCTCQRGDQVEFERQHVWGVTQANG